jgi:uncharacterized protein with PIN domain
MLARLARYLRAAGIDTAMAGNGAADAEILRQAADEGRILLTCDRKIMEHKAALGRTLLLPHGSLEAQAAALNREFGLDWLERAFTRCLLDNAQLAEASAEQLEQVPPSARRAYEPFLACPACGRVYWPGSHYRRMRRKLGELQGASASQ